MKYQLVLQWRGDDVPGFEELCALEDEMAERIGSLGEVDGHDLGQGEANIFILTSEPQQTFDRIRAQLGEKLGTKTFKAAFRRVEGDSYTIIWPLGELTFEIA